MALEDLAAKGPLKTEALRGLQNPEEYVKHDDITVINALKEMPPRVGTWEVTDETYYRTGWVLEAEPTQWMLDIAADAKKAIHVKLVE